MGRKYGAWGRQRSVHRQRIAQRRAAEKSGVESSQSGLFPRLAPAAGYPVVFDCAFRWTRNGQLHGGTRAVH